LGYYSRARNLHHAAKQIVSEKKGIIPQKKEELMELKGFGPYISSAVASIAFNEDVPVVDGNVLRVATRFWGLEEDVSKPATRKKIEGLLTNSFPHGHARAFNQGLMELGALVCTPHSPSCGACPLQQGCYAFIHSRQEYYPVKGEKKKSPTKHFAMIVLQEKGKWGLIQRKTKLLHGMWEFPMVEYDPLTDTHSSIEKKFKDEGLDVRIGKGIGVVSHQYSHFNQEVQLFVPANADQTKVEWVSPAQLRTHPFSKVQQKVFDFLRESHIL
jgi:A/G-specific adenine glycosylase